MIVILLKEESIGKHYTRVLNAVFMCVIFLLKQLFQTRYYPS